MDWALAALSLAGGAAVGYTACCWRQRLRRRAAGSQVEALLADARQEAEAIRQNARIEAMEEAARLRREADREILQAQKEIETLRARVTERETLLNRQLDGLAERERSLNRHQCRLLEEQRRLEEKEQELEKLIKSRRRELERAARLSEADAKAILLKEVEEEALRDADALARHIIEEAQEAAEQKARKIVSVAIQRYAAHQTYELTTSNIALNGTDIKGRIIGRDGRNIRAFEAATGVTVLIDDTPNTVVLSAFDPVRREIARQAMERLIADGRIHPTRIEEVVEDVRREMEETILKAGADATLEAGLPPLHQEITRLLGRLRFRRSYSQNILTHSVEVARLCALMAAELELDPMPARRAGLLHDIGKAADHDLEGSHAAAGAEILRRYGESEEVVAAVASHHNEGGASNIYGALVSAADAISAARPGARSESISHYIQRLEALEKIGNSFQGVEKCYAVQAGRELRVMVKPQELSDEQARVLARNLARRIENDLQYPGQIRVTVVRETRCIEYAK
ncbi:MAG: ribonuclease Y [Verrucomicrobia bacterium]|nr:ribonuclease Y [Verrucomicrobiota bacterium]